MTGGVISSHVSGCFDLFAKFNGIQSENYKYVKTQFYRKVSRLSASCDTTTVTHQRRTKHTYQKVSIPKGRARVSRYQQKGIIFLWPQRRKTQPLNDLVWMVRVIAHALYWLQAVHLLPNGHTLLLTPPPPWHQVERRFCKPQARDYIIEPDWDSSSVK
nr:unnamed protein product [Callosobruchus chinensis]